MGYEALFELAAVEARKASCLQAHCGSVIVSADGNVIGAGFNAPPLGLESQRKCEVSVDVTVKPTSDKTCCVHAEWNAILDALKRNPGKVEGSTLFFMRVNAEGEFTEAGKPYCSVCSRLALQSGVKTFGLWNGGPEMFDAEDYNLKTYDFF